MKSRKMNQNVKNSIVIGLLKKQKDQLGESKVKFDNYWGEEIYKVMYPKEEIDVVVTLSKKWHTIANLMKVTSSETDHLSLTLKEDKVFPSSYNRYSCSIVLDKESFPKHREFVRAYRNYKDKESEYYKLRSETKAVVYSFNTTGQLLEALPEIGEVIESCLPSEGSNLPALISGDLMKRLNKESDEVTDV